MRNKKPFVVWGLAASLAVSALSGCSSSKEAGPSSQAESTPQKPVKITVAIWDRGATPSGQSYNDNFLAKWVNQELAKIGVEVEYVPFPRAQEEERLNTWMASGTSPDMVATYNFSLMNKYAEQGGLTPLGKLLDEYGPVLKEENAIALSIAGNYKGERYAIPSQRPASAGATMKIRKDWLDKLNLPIPKTTDELHQTLKAFKEKDPGGVGKDKVVPWALPAFSKGMKGFIFGSAYGFGIRYDAPGLILMPSGNYDNGKFASHISTPQGRNFFQWMNTLYKEELISKEFLTDLNSEKWTQQIALGTTGFVDSNEFAYELNNITRKSVPTANWVHMEPFRDPNGKQTLLGRTEAGMLIMIPKTSKHPEAVIKYLNWMSDPDNLQVLKNGLEGQHYTMENGMVKILDEELYKKDVRWLTNDLAVIKINEGYTPEQYRILYKGEPEKAESYIVRQELTAKFAKSAPILATPTPFGDKNGGTLAKYLYDELSKVIISNDFDKSYQQLLDGWAKVGGAEYDQEITEGLKALHP